MIKKIFGYALAGIGFSGIVYFENYEGDLIPDTNLWLIISAIICLAGLYIAYTSRTKKEIVTAVESSNHRNKLITTGEQIKLDIDNCDIRENDYYEEIPRAGLSGPNEEIEEKYVDQSAIIYYHKIGDTTEKYISQPFPLSTEALRFHILNNEIILYVDRFDRSNYLFDFQINNNA